MRVRNLEEVIWERIEDGWLIEGVAATALGISAVISMLLVAALIGVMRGWEAVSVLSRLLLGGTVLLGVVSALFLMSAMHRYWTKLDNQTGAMHRVWFFLLRFLMFFGPALYYLFVYIPQLRRRWAGGARSSP